MSDESMEALRALIADMSNELDGAFAAAASRYYEEAALDGEALSSANTQTLQLSANGDCDYRLVGVPFEYILRYQGRQTNSALSALFDMLVRHEGPLRIIDVGAGTAAVEVGVSVILHAMNAHGLTTPRVEVRAVERSDAMWRAGRLVLAEVSDRLTVPNLTVLWDRRASDVPDIPLVAVAETWVVAAHVLEPQFSGDEYGGALEGLALPQKAERIVLTSSGRAADYDTIWKTQSTLRRKDGVGQGRWNLPAGGYDVPPSMITTRRNVLPATKAVADEHYLDNAPLPTWGRFPPIIYRLQRTAVGLERAA